MELFRHRTLPSTPDNELSRTNPTALRRARCAFRITAAALPAPTPKNAARESPAATSLATSATRGNATLASTDLHTKTAPRCRRCDLVRVEKADPPGLSPPRHATFAIRCLRALGPGLLAVKRDR